MTSNHLQNPQVAIIGAGLGGLTLALALKQRGIAPKLYEMRGTDYDFGGAVMLSPNALRVLDSINAYQRLRSLGYNFETLTFKNDFDFKTTGVYYFGSQKLYGYNALRIYRNVFIKELRQMAAEQSVPIEYHRKFTHVISEDSSGVNFAFADGSTESAPLLVGADGIHSKVREYLDPGMIATYSGFLGVTFAFSTSKLRFPADHDIPLPASIHGRNGAFIMAPQGPNGEEVFAGRQFKADMRGRDGWDALLKDRKELEQMHQHDMDAWSDFIQSAQEQISSPEMHGLNIWPFHTVPKLSKWSSQSGKVIIMGDGAHAIPPTAGQGANQAFEDSFSLALLLKWALGGEVELQPALKAWQRYRQDRVDQVLVLSDQMTNIRLSEEEKKLLPKERIWHDQSAEIGEGGQMAWLYMHDIGEEMKKVVAGAQK